MTRLFGALVAVMMAGGVAQAADVPAAVPVSPSWTGAYVGAWIGSRASDIDATTCGGGGIIGQNCATNFSLAGFIAGVQAGYDYQFANNVVVGGFLSVPAIRPTTRVTTPLFAPFDISWGVRPRWAAAGGVRVGYAMGNYMPYVLAGVGLARVEVTPTFGAASNATHRGPVVGGGLEVKLTNNVSVDARYMAGFLGSASYQFCPDPGCRSSYKEVSHNVTLGVNFRF